MTNAVQHARGAGDWVCIRFCWSESVSGSLNQLRVQSIAKAGKTKRE